MYVTEPQENAWCTVAQTVQETGQLHAFLLEKLKIDEDSIEDHELEQTITFKQWSTTDRAELVTRTEPVRYYVDLLVLYLDKSTEHSYTTTVQSSYLKSLKETLPENEIIVLEDFAENYTFLVQDEIQGMHWNN